jgi:hypothetical protein
VPHDAAGTDPPSEHGRLAQRVAELEEKLFCVMERNAELQEQNARLRAEVERFGKQNTRLRQANQKPATVDVLR